MMERLSAFPGLEWSSVGLVLERLAFANLTCVTVDLICAKAMSDRS